MTQAEYAEREFRISLQVLALPASVQVRVTAPAHVTAEIANDFDNWSDAFLDQFADFVTSAQRSTIKEVSAALDQVPRADYECLEDVACLERPSWQLVRLAAQRALSALGWPVEAPPAWVQKSPGIWQRGSG